MLREISEFVMGLLVRFRSEAGQALTEYGLILALIAGVSLVALTAVGLAVFDTLECVQEGFT
jgi:Flp pilus assembly pilin Flp